MKQFDFVQDAFDSGNPIIVMKDGLWGIIDKDRNVLIEPKYDYIERFINGFAAVKKNGLWGFVSSEGVEIVSPKFTQIEAFLPQKVAIVSSGRGYGIIDENGKEHLFNNCSNIKSTSSSILFICDKLGFWHVFDTKTNTLNKLEYIQDFWELQGHYVIRNNKGHLGLLQPNGNTVIECKYSSISILNDWMYVVYDDANDCFIYDIIKNSFNYVGVVRVNSVVQSGKKFYLTYRDKDGKIRFIDTTNYMYVPNKYCDEIIENDFGTLKVEIDGKIGYLSL